MCPIKCYACEAERKDPSVRIPLNAHPCLESLRPYIRSGNVKNSPTGIWWLTGEVCPNLERQENRPKDGDFSYWFISRVLKPAKAEEGSHVNR